MARYEAHLTYDVQHSVAVRKVAEQEPHWVYSAITGCPILGPGQYCYLTAYDTDAKRLSERMEAVQSLVGEEPLRRKVERIIFDTKTGVDELGFFFRT